MRNYFKLGCFLVGYFLVYCCLLTSIVIVKVLLETGTLFLLPKTRPSLCHPNEPTRRLIVDHLKKNDEDNGHRMLAHFQR